MYKPNYYEKKEESEQKRLITNKKYNVVEYRENVWKRAAPFINIMSLLTRILPINIAKKNLEKKISNKGKNKNKIVIAVGDLSPRAIKINT